MKKILLITKIIAASLLLSPDIGIAQVPVVSGGTGAPSGTGANGANNAGGDATGLGCGGGGGSWWGGTGGAGKYGGGGGGAGGYYSVSAINWSGGDGGQGVVVIAYYNGASFVSSEVLISGIFVTVPAGVTSAKVWAIGGGGGGGGATEFDGTAGGGGGAGGVAFVTKPVSEGNIISYSLGSGGLAGHGTISGTAGGNTSVTISGTTIYGNGGAAGAYNNTSSAAGGSYSGGDGGAIGGNGYGSTGDDGGGGGGAIGGVNGTHNGNDGGTGANSVDISGLFGACNSAINPSAPTLSTFTPNAGLSGTSITITGSGFTGATSVRFGGVSASSFVVNSSTQITATVAPGSYTGSVSVTLPFVTVSKPVYFFTTPVAPTVSSFTPTSAGTGSQVTISGSKFTGASEVSFGGTPASSFVVNSDYEIIATVDGGSSGNVSVTTSSGTGTKPGFAFMQSQTITFDALADVIYGSSPFTLNAIGGASGNPVTFTSSDPDIATCTGTNGATVSILKTGSVTFNANQEGNESFTDAPEVSRTLKIEPKALTVINAVAANKVYDTGTSASISGATMEGVVGSDDVTLENSTAGTFSSAAVGTGKTVNSEMTISGAAAGNYTLTQPELTADITAANLTVSGFTVADKVYDATTVASLSGAAAVIPLGSDVVSVVGIAEGNFEDKNVGTGKEVTVTGLTLSGADADNYILVQQTGLTADITPANLTVIGLTAINKEYDGNALATLAGSAIVTPLENDVVSVDGIAEGTFADSHIGTDKEVNVTGLTISGDDAGNYNLIQQTGLTADITVRALTISGALITSKIYDGNTEALITGAVLSGTVESEDVVLENSTTGAFEDANAGSGKTVISEMTISGTDAGNYILEQPMLTGTIMPKPLTIEGISVADREYDGTIDAVLTGGTLQGVVSPDEVSLVAGTGSFGNKNAGNDISVSALGYTIEGADAENYELTAQPSGLTADIYPVMLTATADDKTRGQGEANPAFTITYVGFVNGETETELDTEPVASCTADLSSDVGEYDITLEGGTDNNYLFTYVSGKLTVNSLTGISGASETGYLIYPNPAGEYVIIESPVRGDICIKLFNLAGNLVIEGIVPGGTLNVQHLPSGVYYLKIDNYNYKLIKK